MTELSVIVLTYNHEEFILKCLRGIVNQIFPYDINVIISDDFSSDNTNKIVEKFIIDNKKQNFKYTHLTSKKNNGPRKNFNKVTSIIKSKYVAICDGDDHWTNSEKLLKQHNQLTSNDDIVICCHNYDMIFEEQIINKIRNPSLIFNKSMMFGRMKLNVRPSTVFFKYFSDVFSNSSLNSTGFNYDLNRILSKGKGIYLSSSYCNYRINQDGQYYSKSPNERLDISLKNIIQIYLDKDFVDNKLRRMIRGNAFRLILKTQFFSLIKFQFIEFKKSFIVIRSNNLLTIFKNN